jgi:phage baseplate assembly protein W
MASSSNRLPKRFPVGSRYVVESYGSFVRRYVELPNGPKINLATRKASVCSCAVIREDSIVPILSGNVQTFLPSNPA